MNGIDKYIAHCNFDMTTMWDGRFERFKKTSKLNLLDSKSPVSSVNLFLMSIFQRIILCISFKEASKKAITK